MILATNPENKKLLQAAGIEEREKPIFGAPQVLQRMSGLEIVYNPNLPARDIEYKWEPPASSRFIEYEMSDEHWMRPLGLGLIIEIDHGALYYIVDDQSQKTKYSGNRIGQIFAQTKEDEIRFIPDYMLRGRAAWWS